jgi:hypothetical protein
MALPLGTTGSLDPTFVPVRLVGLTVKRASALTLVARFPTVLSPPSSASVTFWEATAPVKLPTWHCPRPGSRAKVRTPAQPGGSLYDGSTDTGVPATKPPTYPAQTPPNLHAKV